MTDSSELYVGYLPQAPAPIARLARACVLTLAALGAALAALFSVSQPPFSSASFEWGVPTAFEGVLSLEPVPNLIVERPGLAAHAPRSRFLLTVYGKHGAEDAMRAFDGRRVRLEGSLIHYDGATMVELVPESIVPLDSDGAGDGIAGAAAAGPVDLGQVTLVGEIVDSKCYLGVMKPGHTKPHRACATRCIAGGVPPVLLVRDAQGGATYFLLTGPEGESLGPRILDRIAEPIEIPGRVCRHDDLLVLASDPETWRPLD